MIFNTKIGRSPTIEALTVTENGTYTAPEGVDGYSPVTVNVPSAVYFTYTGSYTDNRVGGVGEVVFNSSGTLAITAGSTTVTAYMRAGGGGAAMGTYGNTAYMRRGGAGGGGGYRTESVTLAKGQSYSLTIGSGGSAATASQDKLAVAGDGGSTTAFGYTCTGGKGGQARASHGDTTVVGSGGAGGTPNGGTGAGGNGDKTLSGGSPNGGSVVYNGSYTQSTPTSGGAGYITLTFS